jgi:hypothetical protein
MSSGVVSVVPFMMLVFASFLSLPPLLSGAGFVSGMQVGEHQEY